MSEIDTQKKPTGGQAFPGPALNRQGVTTLYTGMLLRDWFAGKAMSGIMATGDWVNFDEVTKVAYNMADAMLAERGNR